MKKQKKAARMDESLGMRRGKEAKKKQSYKARRDESMGMKKAMRKKKAVSADNYVAANEMYDRALQKKEMRGMKTPGIAVELKISQMDEGYSNMPRVKPQKKNAKPKGMRKKKK